MPTPNEHNAVNEALARSAVEAGSPRAVNVDQTIKTWMTNIANSTGDTQKALLLKTIEAFAPKIAEMYFYDRNSSYNTGIRDVINDMYDKDLIYGTGREYSLPNYVPVKELNPDVFVPTEVTTPINTVSRVYVSKPLQVNLTIQKQLYLPIANNAGQLNRFVESLKTSLTTSLMTQIENTIIDDYLLKTSTLATTAGTNTIAAQNDKPTKYEDTTSANTKECLAKVETLINQMCNYASNQFNIGGTNTNAMFRSDWSDIKILCTNKFYNDTFKYGITLGLFKPELLAGIADKFVVVPDKKVVLPATAPVAGSNTGATNSTWANIAGLTDNTLIIVNTKNSFKFGKQYQNTATQYYPINEALQITTNYTPYYTALSFGQMLIYTSNNLNTKAGNVMGNI